MVYSVNAHSQIGVRNGTAPRIMAGSAPQLYLSRPAWAEDHSELQGCLLLSSLVVCLRGRVRSVPFFCRPESLSLFFLVSSGCALNSCCIFRGARDDCPLAEHVSLSGLCLRGRVKAVCMHHHLIRLSRRIVLSRATTAHPRLRNSCGSKGLSLMPDTSYGLLHYHY